MRAIKAGIFTATTKQELERLEGEQTMLSQAIQNRTAKLDKVIKAANITFTTQ